MPPQRETVNFPDGRSARLWSITLDDARSPDWLAGITAGELDRFSQRRPPQQRLLRIAVQAHLRQTLGQILDLPPLEIVFEIAANGRPSSPQALRLGWDFNLSFSPERALIGLTRHGRIGVDLQEILTDSPTPELLTLTLTQHERELYQRTPIANQCRLFTLWWTQKEALYKTAAHGHHFQPHRLPHSSDNVNVWESLPTLAACAIERSRNSDGSLVSLDHTNRKTSNNGNGNVS